MYDYALVHVVYTIPVALALTVALYPLFTRLDVYKISFLICIAVTYTVPWDSYLIRTSIWSYPPDVVLGPALFSIPVEELFFFVVQTYITTLLQILLTKPVLLGTYLRDDSNNAYEGVSLLHRQKRIGQVFFGFAFLVPFVSLLSGEGSTEGTYMRLISAWASPVLLLLWSLSYQFLTTLPRSKVTLPIALPTLYLWVVDTIALRRGTWSISSGTKIGIELWPGLEIEEAIFFLVSNMLVVFGCTAFDNAIAIIETFQMPTVPSSMPVPSPWLLIMALLRPTSTYDSSRLIGLSNASTILVRKSRSFYLASGVFAGSLRADLILLYAFCRVADDLVDNATNPQEAEMWIKHLEHFLETMYSAKRSKARVESALAPFQEHARSVLILLPVDKLPQAPFHALMDGFRIDVSFLNHSPDAKTPIQTEEDLKTYASCVASTVAELCLRLVYAHNSAPASATANPHVKEKCVAAGKRMGLALQYINIARDVAVDAQSDRCYIPAVWFSEASDASPAAMRAQVHSFRKRILDIAFEIYDQNVEEIEDLPRYARDGIRVAVESYIEIGRVLRKKMRRGQPLDSGPKGKASVPRWQRLWVGWRAMLGPMNARRRDTTERGLGREYGVLGAKRKGRH